MLRSLHCKAPGCDQHEPGSPLVALRRGGAAPSSWRLTPRSRCRRFSTTVCVAMPAWSVPGTHSTLRPLMRCQRASVSCGLGVMSVGALRARGRRRGPAGKGLPASPAIRG